MPADVVVAGEVVMDLVAAGPGGPYRALPGGSPANVAVGLARLGVPTRMLARVSGDAFGRALRERLERNGVGTSGVMRAAEPSSVAIVHHGEEGFDLRIDGTADWQWGAGEPAPPQDLAALHVGSLAMVLPPGADRLAELVRDVRAPVSYDPNCRPAAMERVTGARRRVEALLRAADVVKLSAADLDWIRPGADPARFAGELLDSGAAVVAVTLGAAGAIVAGSRLPPRRVRALPVEVADTVGAGDAYMSALLAGLYSRGLLSRGGLRSASGEALTCVFEEAARGAALTCGRHGADPPTARELGVDSRDDE
jgi:fructokinase